MGTPRRDVHAAQVVQVPGEQRAATPRRDKQDAQAERVQQPIDEIPVLRSPTPVAVAPIACLGQMPMDGLCVRGHALFPELMAPASDPVAPRFPMLPPIVLSEAFHVVVGEQVDYLSASHGCWIPALITGVLESGAIELDVKLTFFMDLEEQRHKVRPRTRPTMEQLEWLRSVLREGLIEREAHLIFERHARKVRMQGVIEKAIVPSCLPAACSELDAKLGISGCVCQFKNHVSYREQVFLEDGFNMAVWELLLGVDREYGQAITSSGCEKPSSQPFEAVYDVQQKLGQGVFGEVFLCRSKQTGARRAVKRLKKSQQNSTSPDSFESEIENLRLLDHPHVVKLYEHYEDHRFIYLVMDFCSGGDLQSFVQDHKDRKKYLPDLLVAHVMDQVLRAIGHVHVRGLVHMDLKSANIMLTSAKGTNAPANNDGCVQEVSKLPHVMVIDLGIAKLFRPGDFSNENPAGTPATMAPEVWFGQVTPAADVFSLGVVLYNMLSFGYPFTCDFTVRNARAFWSSERDVKWEPTAHFPKEACRLCRDMLQQERSRRPTTAVCLASPFLVNHRNMSMPKIPRAKVDILYKRLGETAQRSLLYHSVALAIARVWPANQNPTIKYLFGVLDRSNTGQLHKETVVESMEREGIPKAEAREAVEAMDLNRDGRIDWTEFVSACLCLSDPKLEKDVRLIFDTADTDKDGLLTHDDVAGLLAAEHLRGVVVSDVMLDLTGRCEETSVDWEAFKRHFGPPPETTTPRAANNLLGQVGGMIERARDMVFPES